MKNDCGTTDTIHRYQMVLELGAIITSEVNIDALFSVITDQTNRVMETERCSVFLYDEDRDELWSFVSTDLRKGEIRISASEGIVGWAFQHQEAQIINDAYSDPRFYPRLTKRPVSPPATFSASPSSIGTGSASVPSRRSTRKTEILPRWMSTF